MPVPVEHLLRCHPARPDAARCQISASAVLTDDGALRLSYRLRGDNILFPARTISGPADELWQHTCCEAFIGAVDTAEYREFNFSPSGQWAAYRFTEYRVRDTDFQPADAPQISIDQAPDGELRLTALLPRAVLPAGDELQLSLSCVIEHSDQGKTYWALEHCAAQPDFHQRLSFTLPLKAPKP